MMTTEMVQPDPEPESPEQETPPPPEETKPVPASPMPELHLTFPQDNKTNRSQSISPAGAVSDLQRQQEILRKQPAAAGEALAMSSLQGDSARAKRPESVTPAFPTSPFATKGREESTRKRTAGTTVVAIDSPDKGKKFSLRTLPELLTPLQPNSPTLQVSHCTVILRMWVETDGKPSHLHVHDIKISPPGDESLHRIYEKEAIATARQFRFKPAYHGSQPVRVFIQIPIRFEHSGEVLLKGGNRFAWLSPTAFWTGKLRRAELA